MRETETETITEPVVKNKGGRPRKHKAVTAPVLSEDQFAKLLEVLASGNRGNGIDAQALKDVMASAAIVAANHTDKIQNPSNKTHPGKSAFSYPEGDVARPRPVPPLEFLYNGYPCSKFPETEHWRELELMCDVEPGEYTIIRTDYSKMHVIVLGQRDADGKLTKVEVIFGQRDPHGNIVNSVLRSEMNLIPPKSVVLYQIVHHGEKSPKQLFLEGLTEWLDITLGDSVAA